MIYFSNGGACIVEVSELPNPKAFLDKGLLIFDSETTSEHQKKNSLNPWHNCKTLGLCLSNLVDHFYIPLRGQNPSLRMPNLPVEGVSRWLDDLLLECRTLVAHNAKYDLHVLSNDLEVLDDDRISGITVVDTLTLAKLLDSNRFSYGLSALSLDLLGEDISKQEQKLKSYLKNESGKMICQDYGVIPTSVIAEYGVQDVITTGKLYLYLEKTLPEYSNRVKNTETELTKVLYSVERRGMRVDPLEVRKTQINVMGEMLEIVEKINEITGYGCFATSTDDCYDVLVNFYGLPIIKHTDTQFSKSGDMYEDYEDEYNPSFGKDVFKEYLAHPRVQSDPSAIEVVTSMLKYRELSTFNGLFLKNYENLEINGILHCNYNQCVSTGRLSCSLPNMQQLSKLAKGLILPNSPGLSIVDIDLKSIEFRLIAHYLNDPRIIAEYLADPNTDYHDVVAKMCGIERSPAKNMNFMLGYGGGRKKCVTMLKSSLKAESITPGMSFDGYMTTRANEIYDNYHKMLPLLRERQEQAQNTAARQGFVRNMYGRKRILDSNHYYRAFNTVIQSTAADMFKEITLLVENYCKNSGEFVQFISAVHDSWILICETGREKYHSDKILDLIVQYSLHSMPVELRVPVLADAKFSTENWAQCG